MRTERKTKIGIEKRARMELNVGKSWFGGILTQDEAEMLSDLHGLNMDMIKYHYGREYHKQEQASHG